MSGPDTPSGGRPEGVLLVNLGSPESPSVSDVRTYLGEFLMDPRVIDLPLPLRWFLVRAIILPRRPARSAEAYRSIWWEEGSPLMVLSRRLRDRLGERLLSPVGLAMRYGSPSIGEALLDLTRKGVERVLLAPLYPHYAMSTYESVVVEATAQAASLSPSPELQILPPFYDHPLYIDALVARVRDLLKPDHHLLLSFHGLPERHLRRSDPTGTHCLVVSDCCAAPSPAHATCYRHQVLETSAAFLARAGLDPAGATISFQSRLGRARWLTPYTSDTLAALPGKGIRRVQVLSPAFVTDCLETLEELGLQGRDAFLAAGGESFELLPCLNDHPGWVEALEKLCRERGVS